MRIATENTGIYHLKLVTLLIKNDLSVAVMNALKIKRFSQMKMYCTKTDKADAKIIAMYGAEQKFKAYKSKGNYSRSPILTSYFEKNEILSR